MIEFFKSMGPLRNMLHALAVLLMFILPFSHPTWHPQGIELILGAVIPAFAPIVMIIIMFDVLMCKVQQSDAEDIAVKKLYGNMIKTHLIIVTILLALWILAFQDGLFI